MFNSLDVVTSAIAKVSITKNKVTVNIFQPKINNIAKLKTKLDSQISFYQNKFCCEAVVFGLLQDLIYLMRLMQV